MTHLEWGLLMVAAALVLGGLASGPVWYAAGHRHGREDRSYGDGPRHRKGDPAPGYLLELPLAFPENNGVNQAPGQVGEYGPFPVPEEEYLLLTSPLLPAEYETPAGLDTRGKGKGAVDSVSSEVMTAPFSAEFERHACEAMAVANEPQEDLSVTAWTEAMAADMDRYMARLIGGTDEQLKEITR